jgi:transposase
VSVTRNQRSELSSIAQPPDSAGGLHLSSQAHFDPGGGSLLQPIKRRLQTSDLTIIGWKQRFLEFGLDGADTYHPGQKATVLTPALRPDSVGHPQATQRRFHPCHKLATALGVSKDAVHRFWKEAGLTPHRLERYLASNDPEFESKAADIISLCLRPP